MGEGWQRAGGLATAARMTPEERHARARKAAQARWDRVREGEEASRRWEEVRAEPSRPRRRSEPVVDPREPEEWAARLNAVWPRDAARGRLRGAIR